MLGTPSNVLVLVFVDIALAHSMINFLFFIIIILLSNNNAYDVGVCHVHTNNCILIMLVVSMFSFRAA